jgi:heme exporter protein D
MVMAVSVVLALAAASALLASFLPRRWISIAVLVSLPIALLGSAMFFALGNKGDAYYIWLFLGIGSLMSSAIAAVISATAVLRMAAQSTPAVERDARKREVRPSP